MRKNQRIKAKLSFNPLLKIAEIIQKYPEKIGMTIVRLDGQAPFVYFYTIFNSPPHKPAILPSQPA